MFCGLLNFILFVSFLDFLIVVATNFVFERLNVCVFRGDYGVDMALRTLCNLSSLMYTMVSLQSSHLNLLQAKLNIIQKKLFENSPNYEQHMASLEAAELKPILKPIRQKKTGFVQDHYEMFDDHRNGVRNYRECIENQFWNLTKNATNIKLLQFSYFCIVWVDLQVLFLNGILPRLVLCLCVVSVFKSYFAATGPLFVYCLG